MEQQETRMFSSLTSRPPNGGIRTLSCRGEGYRLDQALKQEVKKMFKEGHFADD